MQPDPNNLMRLIGIEEPLIGFYDAPDPAPFEPLVEPNPLGEACVFVFYKKWLRGETLHLTKDNCGCRGAGYWLCHEPKIAREELVRFLTDDEGLKPTRELMARWLDHTKRYQPEHAHLFVGPLKRDQYQYLKSVTFLVNPDQLGALLLGAQYHRTPEDPPHATVPFGAGCMQLVTLFEDLNIPQAVVNATDIASRQYLPPHMMGFSVTKPMFEELCALDERSFLHKEFWTRLKKSRKKRGSPLL